MQKRHILLDWALGACLTVVMFAALYAVSNFRYENSDDALILKSLMGFEGGVPSDFSLYVHTLLMGALSALSRALPGKPWFSLFQLGLLALSCTVIVKSLLTLSRGYRYPRLAGLLIGGFYLALFAAFACCRVNYTTTAALAGAASLLQCMTAGTWEARRAQTLRAALLAFLLLTAAWCLRPQSAWPTAAFWLLWLGWRLWVNIRQKQILRPVLLMLLTLVLLAGGLTVIRQAEVAARGLQPELDWHTARTKLMDYTAFESDPAPALAADSGLTATEVTLAQQWYFLDANMTAKSLQTMADAYPAPSLSRAATRLGSYAADNPMTVAAFGVLAIVCLLCWLGGRTATTGAAVTATLALAGALAMVGYLGFQGRILARAVDAALFPCAAMLFGLLAALPVPTRKARGSDAVESIHTEKETTRTPARATRGGNSPDMAPGTAPKPAPARETRVHKALVAVCLCGLLALGGLHTAGTLRAITRKPDAVSQEREQELETYALNHPDTLVVRSPMLLRDTRLFPSVGAGIPANILLWGDWSCHTPGWYAQLTRYGVDGHTFAAADWLSDRLVLAATDDHEAQTLCQWLTDATGAAVEPTVAGEEGSLRFYRFGKGLT